MEKSQDMDISDRRAVDALYRISTLSGNEQNPVIALQGILDEVRVYDRAISEQEVETIYSLTPIEKIYSDCIF